MKTKLHGTEKRFPTGRYVGGVVGLGLATGLLYLLQCPGLHEPIRKDRVVVLEQTSSIRLDSIPIPGKNGAPDTLKVTATAICPENAHDTCNCDPGYVNKAKPGEPMNCVEKKKPVPKPKCDDPNAHRTKKGDCECNKGYRDADPGPGVRCEQDRPAGPCDATISSSNLGKAIISLVTDAIDPYIDTLRNLLVGDNVSSVPRLSFKFRVNSKTGILEAGDVDMTCEGGPCARKIDIWALIPALNIVNGTTHVDAPNVEGPYCTWTLPPIRVPKHQ